MAASEEKDPAVQTLLKLKRYERPPEPFFDRLNRDVMRRLQGPEGTHRASLFSLLDVEFGLKPSMFYGLGAVFCAVACYGLAQLLVRTDNAAEADAVIPLAQLTASPPAHAEQEVVRTPASLGDFVEEVISTGAVFHASPPGASLPIIRVRGVR